MTAPQPGERHRETAAEVTTELHNELLSLAPFGVHELGDVAHVLYRDVIAAALAAAEAEGAARCCDELAALRAGVEALADEVADLTRVGVWGSNNAAYRLRVLLNPDAADDTWSRT